MRVLLGIIMISIAVGHIEGEAYGWLMLGIGLIAHKILED